MNPRIGIYLLLSALFTSSLLLISSYAISDEPASQGRPITPAGSLVKDMTTRQAAVGALPVDFVRSPDESGPDGAGRFLLSVNSGYGIQFNSAGNRGQQSLSVIDLNAKPAAVVQNVYFPSPQSVNVGVAFSPQPQDDGSYALYVSGGFENKIWIFRFHPENQTPITPASPGPNTNVEAPFIDVGGFAFAANSPRYNSDRAPVYPAGIAITLDGNTLFVANNLGDSLGVIEDVNGRRKLTRIDLRREGDAEQFIYPYAVVVVPQAGGGVKAYVSCWNDSSVAIVTAGAALRGRPFELPVARVPVGRHPTTMLLNPERTRLYVANSNDDTVSVIDTQTDKEIERINVRLSEDVPAGNSPEGLALRDDELYVANAHSNSVAVIQLSNRPSGEDAAPSNRNRDEAPNNRNRDEAPSNRDPDEAPNNRNPDEAPNNRTTGEDGAPKNRASQEGGLAPARSKIKGFIPTGQYPSALFVVGTTLFIGNGKGTGLQNSSLVVDNSGRVPNAPNDRFPTGSGRANGQGGEYSVALVAGNISAVNTPDDPALARYTQQVMRNNGLLGERQARLFPGRSPIKHVIYVIKENRTYDQVLGDLEKSGDGTKADGDPSLAIFGAGEAAARPNGQRQDISPNHRALALRFGLFDRFFVNSEASPDGHNWSTAAFSTDYVDKAFRWNYSRRGRTYDFEGFNRLPNYEPVRGAPSLFGPRATAADVTNFMRRFIPYLQGSRDVAEPESLYLWDAAARAGLSYRNYGEFVATLSEADVKAIRENRAKSYPDLSPTISAFPTKKSLEGRVNTDYRNFDMNTPDAMTVDSYRAARESNAPNPLIDKSRLSAWLEEFRAFAAERSAGTGDRLPNLSVMRLPNDHTDGIGARKPTPQFYVADNDYALGLMVEAVSNSAYWKDTAIVVLEDDAQDGPDHVDAHRSVALVISAYNKPGALVHEFHNTVSLIRTIELLLGIEPMNQLDATATPVNIFRTEPDLRPYKALLPNVAIDNLVTPPARDAATAYWMRRSEEQDLERADMADPEILNRIIWFSVRGNVPMPSIARLPAFDAMRLGLQEEREEIADKTR